MLTTDILCYDSASGRVAIFASDATNSLQKPPAFSATWEPNLLIVPGQFTARQPGSTATGVYSDLFVYNRTTGQAQFYSTDGSGNRTALGPATPHTWTHIVAGIFTPDGIFTDLLCYDQNSGAAQFYSTDGAGNLNLLISYPFVHWTHIVSGYFRPNASTMDLLFYDAPSGRAEFYSVWNGNITLMQSYDNWLTTWAQVVPGTFRDNGNTDDFLLYDPTRGLASFLSTDGVGGIATILDYPDWNQDWTNIVAGYFLRDMTCSTLLIYSASRDQQGLMGIGGQANENPLGGFGSFGGWTDLIPGKLLKVQLETWRNFDEPSLTRVEAYASSDSVAAGQSIDICAETEQIYRGHYFFQFSVRIDRCGIADFTFEAAGVGRPQDTPADASRVGCGWRSSMSIQIPATCRSGVYYATITAGSLSTQVPFVVRAATPSSNILLEIATATMQAYNGWGGHSLYSGIPLGSTRVPIVSYDRPLSNDSNPATLAALPGFIYNRLGILSSDFIEWLETNNGIQVDYCTSVDLHLSRAALGSYRLLISHFHDEYWSFEMRSNVEAFLASGGNVAFLGANTCWWQIRIDGTGRFITSWKYNDENNVDSGTADPFAATDDPNLQKRSTVYWWDPLVNRPELSMTGVTFRYGWMVARGWPNFPPRGYTVAVPDSWVFDGTGVGAGSVFGQESGIMGGEVDSALGLYANGTKFGNIYWDLAYPNSPAGFVELAYCDLYQVPGFAGFVVPVEVLATTGNTATINIPSPPFAGWSPVANQYFAQGSLVYKITRVTPQGNSLLLNLSPPFFQPGSGANVIYVPTGWASMGIFKYGAAADDPYLRGWVFNAGTISWTNGLDPSNLSTVSKITLNVLKVLAGVAPIAPPRLAKKKQDRTKVVVSEKRHPSRPVP